MSRFVTESDVESIHAGWWEDDESVTIRRFTIARRDKMHSEILKVTGTVGKLTEIEVKAAQVPILMAGIASWTFKMPDGTVAPVDLKWVGDLGAEDADFISTAINELNKARSAEEQAKF